MTDIKWIKVTVDMFEDSKIEFLRSLPEGDSVIVIWLQLLSLAGKSNADGYLMITEGIPYTEQVLSNTLRRNPVLLQYALESFLKLKMINVEDGPFHITKWEKHQSAMRMEEIKSKSALKQAAYRLRQKEKQLLLAESNEKVTDSVTCYVTNDVTKGNSYQTDIELDKEKDIKSSGPKGPARTKFIPPILEEVIIYCEERCNCVDPEKWFDHYTANGWKVGKNQMKDWKAAVRTWEKSSSSNSTSTVGRTGTAAHHINPSEKEARQSMRIAGLQKDAEVLRHPPLSEVGEY